jgi:hypothetical protein
VNISEKLKEEIGNILGKDKIWTEDVLKNDKDYY